ncbi:MAG: hypothetical protein JXB50_12575, partial [Spirochaetes bacterium]|nr:hypothetical protein [Spirochaetota bacterium]
MTIFKRQNILMSLLSMTIVMVLIILSCNLTVNEYAGESISPTSGTTMDGSFKISVSPESGIKSSLMNKSIVIGEFTVTSMDITVTKVSDQTVIGTYHWTPADGLKDYDVDISG